MSRCSPHHGWLFTCLTVGSCLVASAVLADGVAPQFRDEPIQPIAPAADIDRAKAALGRRLFFEPRLSHNDSVSCAHCHDLQQRGGADGLRRSFGIDGRAGGINAPTVLNSSLNFRQFWDGRADSLESQIDGPTHNPVEMGSNWEEIVGKLSGDSAYVLEFHKVFGQSVSADGIRSAIAEFERTLLTPNAPFDRYLRGDLGAIGADEKQGYELFKSYGCVSCHQGQAVGGNMYEKMGIMGDYFADRGHVTKIDWGRYNVTGVEEHRFEFKVPSLRNVEQTAPYFHDGEATTLEQAIHTMGKYQLGREIPPGDVGLIAAFLRSLSGQVEQAHDQR